MGDVASSDTAPPGGAVDSAAADRDKQAALRPRAVDSRSPEDASEDGANDHYQNSYADYNHDLLLQKTKREEGKSVSTDTVQSFLQLWVLFRIN